MIKMKSNLQSRIFILYLLISFCIIGRFNSIKAGKNQLLKETTGKNLNEEEDKKVDKKKLAADCMKGVMNTLPPAFCWKKGADVGKIPTGCPEGYFRSLALCYKQCKPGYKFVLGVCWEICPQGYKNLPLRCWKKLFSWYFKHSYIPHILTNFSDKVPCGSGRYRVGALCYRDCANVGLENCGIGACSSSKESCASSIWEMVESVIQSLIDSVILIASFGTSASFSTAKNTLKQGIKKIGKEGMKKAMKSALNSLKGKFKDITFDKAFKYIKQYSKETFASGLSENFVKTFCTQIWNDLGIKGEEKVNSDINLDTVIDTVDVLNISGSVEACKDTSDGGLNCAKNVLSSLSLFDPTGILSVASAFMQPKCEVPDKPYEFEKEVEEATETVSKVQDPKCVRIFSECNFQGKAKDICQDVNDLGDFNDKISSMISGAEVDVIVFEHKDHQGRSLILSKSQSIKCFEDKETYVDGVTLNNFITSMYLNKHDCIFVATGEAPKEEEDYPKDINNWMYCGESKLILWGNVPWRTWMNIFSINEKYKATLYTQQNFQGESIIVDDTNTYNDYSQFPHKEYHSIKVHKLE
jgi:hypothetical protein